MITFEVTPQNTIVQAKSGRKRQPNSPSQFSSESELIALTSNWPSRRFVDVWNELPEVELVTRFASRRLATHRIWREIQGSVPLGTVVRPVPGTSPAHVASAPKSKAQRILCLIGRPAGATLAEIMAATGWQRHSIRGFISAHIGKRLGHRVHSFTRNGERVYRIGPKPPRPRGIRPKPGSVTLRK